MKLYESIANNLAEDILSGKYKGGEKLPSVREFARDNDVSHVTSSNVYKKLVDDGLITATQKGYIVLDDCSDFVIDYHLKKIEKAYFEIVEAQEKLGYTDEQMTQYIVMLKEAMRGR